MALAPAAIGNELNKLSPDAASFLDAWFTTPESISSAQFILESLTEEHTNLLRRNTRLEAQLAREAARACDRSEKALAALSGLAERVGRTKDNAEAASAESAPLVKRLAELAHEVARVEKVPEVWEYLESSFQIKADLMNSLVSALIVGAFEQLSNQHPERPLQLRDIQTEADNVILCKKTRKKVLSGSKHWPLSFYTTAFPWPIDMYMLKPLP